MSVLWTARDAQAATGGSGPDGWSASGVSIDTRTLLPGDLFVALTDVRDGHDFVQQALEKGASAALVSRHPKGVPATAPLLVVPDVLEALEKLAIAARARSDALVVAVTGSVGKTTTKDMLHHVLSSQGATHAAEKSLNNHWGVPLTLARMPKATKWAVIEVGMNHPGEIRPLSRIAKPDVAIVTTVAEVHLSAFEGINGIAQAKAELFEGMQPGGQAILNGDIDTLPILSDAARAAGGEIVTFGARQPCDYRLLDVKMTAGNEIVKAQHQTIPLLFKIGGVGRHLAVDALAVLAAVSAAGADLAVAALDLANWHPPEGRGQRHRVALDPIDARLDLELIDEAYNANPASMAAAFEVLRQSAPVDGIGRIQHGRRIAILTDMLELGPTSAEKHASLATLPAMAFVDIVHCAGPMMKHLHRALDPDQRGEWHESAETLAKNAHRLLDAGDVVMVKGSKGSHASHVVDAILKLGNASQ